MLRPPARERCSTWPPARRLVLAVALAVVATQAGAQSLPSGAQYQVPAGIPGGVQLAGPNRGVQGWATDWSMTGIATLTNNANYGASNVRQGDLILQFIPAVSFNREGGRFRTSGYVALNFLGYVDGTQVSSILPTANVTATLEAIDNLFYIDGGLSAGQSVLNPYLPRSGYSSTSNIYTSTQARLSPYMKGRFGPYTSWLVRSDNTFTWTSAPNNPLGNAYYVRNTAEVVRQPTPLGWSVRLTNDITQVDQQAQPNQTLNTGIATVDYAFTPQLTLGLRGGYETTTYTAEEVAGPIYGASISWRPSPLTSLTGYWDDRFYGPSYLFEASHRQRRLASSLTAYRTLTTYPQVLLTVPATNSVAGILNAILVARFPDPVERQKAINDLINRQGLPQALPAGTVIYNQSANILQGLNLNWALTGVRNTLGWNVFYLKTEYLPDARIPPTFLSSNNSIQQGGGVTLSHLMAPDLALNGTLSTQLTRGFGITEGLKSRQALASLQANYTLSARSVWFVGTRYQYQSSANVAFPGYESSEFAVFTGLYHRL